jgi:hypothetical protein
MSNDSDSDHDQHIPLPNPVLQADVKKEELEGESKATKRPSKPIGKSFLKMRGKSLKERTSVTSPSKDYHQSNTSKPTASEIFTKSGDADTEPRVTISSPSSIKPFLYQNDPENESNAPGTLLSKSQSPPEDRETIETEHEAVAEHFALKSNNQFFNPIASSRRKSLLGPPPMSSTQPESLFLQSLRGKSDLIETKPPQPPPPPKKVLEGSEENPLNIFNPRRKGSINGQPSGFQGNETIRLSSPDNVNVSAGNDSVLTFSSLRNNTNQISTATARGSSFAEMTLQEYLSTPMTLRASANFDSIFQKPVDEFLSQTNQILFDCEGKLKQLIHENVNLIPHLKGSSSIRQAAEKTNFSVDKIESYLHNQSTYLRENNADNNTSSYQQLLQEKEIIINLLQFMKVSEEDMIRNIQAFEMEALQRIQQESSFYRSELQAIEADVKFLNKQNCRELNEKMDNFNNIKSVLGEKYSEMQDNYANNLATLLHLAKDLEKQQLNMVADRKKMLKQRYQLDLLLQDINDAQYSGDNEFNFISEPAHYHQQPGLQEFPYPSGTMPKQVPHSPSFRSVPLEFVSSSGGIGPNPIGQYLSDPSRRAPNRSVSPHEKNRLFFSGIDSFPSTQTTDNRSYKPGMYPIPIEVQDRDLDFQNPLNFSPNRMGRTRSPESFNLMRTRSRSPANSHVGTTNSVRQTGLQSNVNFRQQIQSGMRVASPSNYYGNKQYPSNIQISLEQLKRQGNSQSKMPFK